METATPQHAVSEEPFELVIRLQQFKADFPLDGTILRAQALVKDVMMSKLGVDAEIDAQENVRAQGSTDLGKVLAASRALQIAFEGFRDASSAGHTSVAIVLDSPPVWDPDISSISPPPQQRNLVTSAKPSQVLMTRPFYDRVPYSQSACRLLPMPGDVYEFLWTNEQKLHEMQAEAARMPPHVQQPAPLPAPSPAPLPVLSDPVLPPLDRVIPEPPDKAPDWQDSEVLHEPEPTGLDQGARLKWLSGRRIFALTGGAVLVMLFAWFLYSYLFTGKPTPTPATTAVVTPAATTAPPVAEPVIANVVAKPVSTPPPTVVSPKPVKKSHTCAIDGPIPAFLKRAEADSSNGKYESAIRRFTEILECEPGNREAAVELQKAKDSQKYAP